MKRFELESGCKINLCLEITGQRLDGYHTLESYFLPLAAPSDKLVITLASTPGCKLFTATPGIDPENNTLTKAYRLFAEAVPEAPGVAIELIKGVPHGAGLGGGSADAAALLKFLNSRVIKSGAPGLEESALLALAARVGADVPFFILNRPAWVSGIGEIIHPDESPLEPYKNMHLVLLCPEIHVSTPWAFKEWDKLKKRDANALTYQGRHDSNNSADVISFTNSLENPVFAAFPQLKAIKEKLLAFGAKQAVMSGSGSGIFGLFTSADEAGAAGGAFRTEGLRVYIQALYTGVSPSW